MRKKRVQRRKGPRVVKRNPIEDGAVLIEDLELSARVRKICRLEGYSVVSELWEVSDQYLLRTPNFGRKSLNELRAYAPYCFHMTREEYAQKVLGEYAQETKRVMERRCASRLPPILPTKIWYPIDTAPEDVAVFVGWENTGFVAVLAHKEGEVWGGLIQGSVFEPLSQPPTHWMVPVRSPTTEV